MKKITITIIAALAALFITGCGPRVEVPTAAVGKISTQSGLQDELIQTSKFRLNPQFPWSVGNSLILAPLADIPVYEGEMNVFMGGNDRLNLTIDVRGILAIDRKEIEQIFERVPASHEQSNRVKVIPSGTIYEYYARPVMRETIRSTVANYSIMDVIQNRDAISAEIHERLAERLKGTPLYVRSIGLADVQPPKVIVQAEEKAKQREIEIQEAEANKAIRLKEAEADLAVAGKQREIDIMEAETQVLVEQKLAEAVSSAFVMQRSLRIWEAMAQSPNKIFFAPNEAISNPSVLMPIVNKALEEAGE